MSLMAEAMSSIYCNPSKTMTCLTLHPQSDEVEGYTRGADDQCVGNTKWQQHNRLNW